MEKPVILESGEITKETLEKLIGEYVKSLNLEFGSKGFPASSLGEYVFWMDKPLTLDIIDAILSKDWGKIPEFIEKINNFIKDEVNYQVQDEDNPLYMDFRSDEIEKMVEYIQTTVNEMTYELTSIHFSTDEEVVSFKKFQKDTQQPLLEPAPFTESSVKPDTTCDCVGECGYGYESSDYDSDIEDRYNYVFGPAGGPNPGIWGVGE